MCPHCGEAVDTSPDSGGGRKQVYVEDCPVCCRPNKLTATYDPDEDGYHVDAQSDE
jgi:hypothetical protein